MSQKLETLSDPFAKLVAIMRQLRGPDGCPWDREQTHSTLKQYLIEESHEVCKAIDEADDRELCSELGDVALQVVFHAQIASEENRFSIEDVLNAVCKKLIHRHPHVFGDEKVADADEVLRNWERIKSRERPHQDSILSGVPKTLPALQRAHRVQEKAANVGFDWKDPSGALDKIKEELQELVSAVEEEDGSRQVEELGDLLFSVVNYSRLLGSNAEDTLHKAIEKFDKRFRKMENKIKESNTDIHSLSIEEMDQHWNAVKKGED